MRFPGTSANLGPGFDAVGLAMGLWLGVRAEVADSFSVTAAGRDAELCGALEGNLILETYRRVAGAESTKLRVFVENGIPVGMGCGSSAAAILAGVSMANHFESMGWSAQQVMEEACRIEGHPDNVAACWLGGFVVSAMNGSGVIATSCGRERKWKLMVVVPGKGLATSKARGMLPQSYSKEDVVFSVQRVGLLVAAMARGQGDLLRVAMEDRIHQPYRAEACPMLGKLLPMAGDGGVLGVALSGAGPSVLLVLDEGVDVSLVEAGVRERVGAEVEMLVTGIAGGAVESFGGTG